MSARQQATVRAVFARHTAIGDVALWCALAVPVLLGAPVGLITVLSRWWLLGGLAVLAVAVRLGRGYPLVAVTLAAGLSLLDVWFLPAMFVMCYVTGRRGGRDRAPLLLFATILITGAVAGLVFAPQTVGYRSVVPLLIGGVLPWLVSRYRRQHRELEFAGQQRAAQLAREHRMIAEQARMLERSRIAQDMHDQLGHDLSVVVLRVAALEVDPRLDASAQAAVGELRSSAAAAVERLHDIIGMLDTGDVAADSPQPVRETVAEIVEGVRSCGVAVELVRAGDDHEPPALIDQVVRRVVREALTNAVKYAPGSAITVTVTGDVQQTRVQVVNGRPPAGPLPDQRGSGLGLVGLHEQVRAIGGEFRAGGLEGGFEVTVRLPHPVATSTDPSPARRNLITVIGLPVALVAMLVAAMMVYVAEVTDSSVLSPGQFAALRIGEPSEQVRQLLPASQVRTASLTQPPAPPAAECAFYRSRNGDLLETEFTVHRLCFAGGKLVAKDVATASGG